MSQARANHRPLEASITCPLCFRTALEFYRGPKPRNPGKLFRKQWNSLMSKTEAEARADEHRFYPSFVLSVDSQHRARFNNLTAIATGSNAHYLHGCKGYLLLTPEPRRTLAGLTASYLPIYYALILNGTDPVEFLTWFDELEEDALQSFFTTRGRRIQTVPEYEWLSVISLRARDMNGCNPAWDATNHPIFALAGRSTKKTTEAPGFWQEGGSHYPVVPDAKISRDTYGTQRIIFAPDWSEIPQYAVIETMRLTRESVIQEMPEDGFLNSLIRIGLPKHFWSVRPELLYGTEAAAQEAVVERTGCLKEEVSRIGMSDWMRKVKFFKEGIYV